MFIIALVAGLFAFLEYQIHDLPPLHYSLIQFDPMERRRAINPTPSTSNNGLKFTSPTILASNGQWTPSAHITDIAPTRPPVLGRAVQTAAPDPRPPDSNYPGAAPTRDIYCGWKPPTWVVGGIAMTGCAGIPCALLPVLCSPDATKVTYA